MTVNLSKRLRAEDCMECEEYAKVSNTTLRRGKG